MKTFVLQLKWQLTLLQKNNIIGISLGVTFIYGVILFFLRDVGNLDKVLVSFVLNDPSVIGYFFIALAIYTEIKHQILPAIFVTPINIHVFLISKTISISLLGVICSLGLAISVLGLNFDIISYTIGSIGLCTISALLGLFMLTYADEFLKFAMLSIPVFLGLINLPLLQYMGAMDVGFIKYLFPIQGCLDLIDYSISGTSINYIYSYFSIVLLVPVIYIFAYKRFIHKIVRQ